MTLRELLEAHDVDAEQALATEVGVPTSGGRIRGQMYAEASITDGQLEVTLTLPWQP